MTKSRSDRSTFQNLVISRRCQRFSEPEKGTVTSGTSSWPILPECLPRAVVKLSVEKRLNLGTFGRRILKSTKKIFKYSIWTSIITFSNQNICGNSRSQYPHRNLWLTNGWGVWCRIVSQSGYFVLLTTPCKIDFYQKYYSFINGNENT